MSELRRWSAEDATPEERQLLEASRAERPDPAARARTLLALGIGAPPGGGPSSGPGGPGAAGVGGATGVATKGTLIQLLVLGSSALALGAAIVFGVSTARGRAVRPMVQPSAKISARASPGPAPAVPPVAAGETEPAAAPNQAPALEPAPSVRPRPARRVQRTVRAAREERAGPPALEPSLAEEVAALDRARADLAAGETAAALRALDAYRARFVQGKLADEEIVLRVQALLARGDRAGAASVERAFSTEHPDSPYVARLRALVQQKK